ncbi:MAG: hypothetical protein ACTSPQ_09945 [Candidatus Helarchaeota archaeon]
MIKIKLKDFLNYDEFHILFPAVQDDNIKTFGKNLKTFLGSECKIIRKATNDPKKRDFKNKDILSLVLKNSKKGLIGLLICLNEFEELLEIKAVKQLHKFEVPREIRDLNNKFFDYINHLKENFKNNNLIEELKYKNFSQELLDEIKKLSTIK